MMRFSWFRRFILKLAFDYQSKPRGFEGMSKSFIDGAGFQYWKYDDDFDIPILRKQKIDEAMLELGCMLTKNEVELFIQAMKTLLHKAIYNTDKGKITNIAEISLLVEEMSRRKEMLIHEDILFKMIGCMHIREDQDPAAWDDELEWKKIEQFKKDSRTGLRDFFVNAGLKRYVPFLEVTAEEFREYLEMSRVRIQAMERMARSYSSGGVSSVADTQIN